MLLLFVEKIVSSAVLLLMGVRASQKLPLITNGIDFANLLESMNYCLPESAPKSALIDMKQALASAFEDADSPELCQQMVASLIKDGCDSLIAHVAPYHQALLNKSIPNILSNISNIELDLRGKILYLLNQITPNQTNEILDFVNFDKVKTLLHNPGPVKLLGILLQFDGQLIKSPEILHERILSLCLSKSLADILKSKDFEAPKIITRLLVSLNLKDLFSLYLLIQHSLSKDLNISVLRILILNDYIFTKLSDFLPLELDFPLNQLNQQLVLALENLKVNQYYITQVNNLIINKADFELTRKFIASLQQPFLPIWGPLQTYGVRERLVDSIHLRLSRALKPLDHTFTPLVQGNEEEFGHPVCLFDDFKILKKLDSGSHGQILVAEHVNYKKYALKAFPAEEVRNELKFIQTEEKLLSTLQHENVGRVYCSMLAPDNSVILVVKYYPGGNLFDFYRQFKEGDKQESLLRHTTQLLRAIKYLHGQGIAHLDVKGENIVLDENGIAHLIDFGTAQRLSLQNPHTCLSYMPAYTVLIQAPEQILYPSKTTCKEFGGPADLFGLGISLYLMSTLKRPYEIVYYKSGTETDPNVVELEEIAKQYQNETYKLPATGMDKLDRAIRLLTIGDPKVRYDKIFGENGLFDELDKEY